MTISVKRTECRDYFKQWQFLRRIGKGHDFSIVNKHFTNNAYLDDDLLQTMGKGIVGTLFFEQSYVYAGECVRLKEIIENRKRMPVSPLEVRFRIKKGLVFQDMDNTSISDYVYKRDIYALLGRQRITRSLPILCQKRGLYTIDDVSVVSYPLMLNQAYRKDLETEAQIYVYARRTNVTDILRASENLLGAYATRMYKIRRREARETQDTTWVEDGFLLDRPCKAYVVFFIAIYVAGLFRTCPQICNLALYSTLAYLLVTTAYKYMDSLEEYLKLNENTYQVRNIPYKRIYGIGKLFILGYLFLLLLTAVPAFFTSGYRAYKDIQITEFEKVIVPEDIYIQPPMETVSDPLMTEVRVEPIVSPKVLQALSNLLYAIAVLTVLLVLIGAIVVIRKELAQFEKTADEEEDVVESLDFVEEDEHVFIGKRTWKRTEEDKVRRLYRKFIKKHRKELPAIYETPTEIEMAAGVADTEEGKAMHEKYEQARYKGEPSDGR